MRSVYICVCVCNLLMLVVYVSDPLFQDFFITIIIIIIIIIILIPTVARVCVPSEFMPSFQWCINVTSSYVCLVKCFYCVASFFHTFPFLVILCFFKLAKFGELSLWGEVFLTYFIYFLGKSHGISNCVWLASAALQHSPSNLK